MSVIYISRFGIVEAAGKLIKYIKLENDESFLKRYKVEKRDEETKNSEETDISIRQSTVQIVYDMDCGSVSGLWAVLLKQGSICVQRVSNVFR